MNVKIADRIRIGVAVVASLIMLYAMFVSADHISHVAHLIGLSGYQAWTLFILIDIPALTGKAMQLKYFAASTRRTGKKLMILSGILSLACNVSSGWFGGGLGPALYGAFVVGMFLLMEHAVTRIKPAAAVTKAKSGPKVETPTPRQLAARKAAATRAQKAAAPTSPGMPPVREDLRV